MKQYISPSSIAFELQTTSLMSMSTNDSYTITDSDEIQTQKKGGGIPWEDYMNYGLEDE